MINTFRVVDGKVETHSGSIAECLVFAGIVKSEELQEVGEEEKQRLKKLERKNK